MEFYNEKINYENPFLPMHIFQAFRREPSIGNWHYHKEMEMLVILKGKLEVYLDNDITLLNEGDITLIGSSQLHRDRSFPEIETVYLVLQFDLEHYFDESTIPYLKYFSEAESALSKLNYIFEENREIRTLVAACVNEIYQEWKMKTPGYEIAVNILIKRIVLALLRHDTRKKLNYNKSTDYIRLKPVFDYIEANIGGKIHVEEASRAANVSYYYFVKYFKKVIGMSFMDYVNFKKIKKAEKILLTRDISVAQVGEEIGMPNMAHFYKIFKKYNHCSPHEFRKKMLAFNPDQAKTRREPSSSADPNEIS